MTDDEHVADLLDRLGRDVVTPAPPAAALARAGRAARLRRDARRTSVVAVVAVVAVVGTVLGLGGGSHDATRPGPTPATRPPDDDALGATKQVATSGVVVSVPSSWVDSDDPCPGGAMPRGGAPGYYQFLGTSSAVDATTACRAPDDPTLITLLSDHDDADGALPDWTMHASTVDGVEYGVGARVCTATRCEQRVAVPAHHVVIVLDVHGNARDLDRIRATIGLVPDGDVVVPYLTDAGVRGAETALERHGLTPGSVTPDPEQTGTPRAGTVTLVASSDPEAGRVVPRGTTVDLTTHVVPAGFPGPITGGPPQVTASHGARPEELTGTWYLRSITGFPVSGDVRATFTAGTLTVSDGTGTPLSGPYHLDAYGRLVYRPADDVSYGCPTMVTRQQPTPPCELPVLAAWVRARSLFVNDHTGVLTVADSARDHLRTFAEYARTPPPS